MRIKLTPVINIEIYGLEGLETPKNGPYWDYADDWATYNKNAQIKQGFTGTIEMVSKSRTVNS